MVINIQSANLLGQARRSSLRRTSNYDGLQGSHNWPQTDSENQSPINILEKSAQKFPIRELLNWNHYDDMPTEVTLENDGCTVIVRATYAGNTPTVSGADLLASYSFIELCFRWSGIQGEGSEHMINYKKYPMELQAMHRAGQATQITSSYDILMIAYFFEISAANPYLKPIVQNLHRIRKPHTKVSIPPFPLSYLCYQFRNGFYSYGGSLTQPPCFQGVEWFILPEPLAISERQISEFYKLLSGNGKERIMCNTRPIQALTNKRVVNLNVYEPKPVNSDQVVNMVKSKFEDYPDEG